MDRGDAGPLGGRCGRISLAVATPDERLPLPAFERRTGYGSYRASSRGLVGGSAGASGGEMAHEIHPNVTHAGDR